MCLQVSVLVPLSELRASGYCLCELSKFTSKKPLCNEITHACASLYSCAPYVCHCLPSLHTHTRRCHQCRWEQPTQWRCLHVRSYLYKVSVCFGVAQRAFMYELRSVCLFIVARPLTQRGISGVSMAHSHSHDKHQIACAQGARLVRSICVDRHVAGWLFF